MISRAFLSAAAILAAVSADSAAAQSLKVATWNIEQLRAENGVGVVKRDDDDYEALAILALELDADVIALQEVDGPEAAARVFPATEYDFFFSDRNNVQRTGFAVRKEIDVVADEDFTALALDGSVRRGTDITVRVGGQDIRMLSVHLKSRCFDAPLTTNNRHCRKLNQQVPILELWIDNRSEEGVTFVVLGDFNRRFDAQGDDFWPMIDDGAPVPLDLFRVTEERTSECRGGEFPVYIDHIVLDEQANDFLVPDSFEQILTTEQDEQAFKLSDHCAIAVTLNLAADAPDDLKTQLLQQIEAVEDELGALRETVEALP